jgi:hypothetical protein
MGGEIGEKEREFCEKGLTFCFMHRHSKAVFSFHKMQNAKYQLF